MRAERHRGLGDLAQLGQRHHLEAAGVGQHGAAPAGEALQAAKRRDALGARPQHQVIGVAEHDVGAGIAHLAPVHALHGAGCADRHEGRCAHHAVRRGQAAGAGRAVGRQQLEMVGKACLGRADIGNTHGGLIASGAACLATSFRRNAVTKPVDPGSPCPYGPAPCRPRPNARRKPPSPAGPREACARKYI